MSSCLKFVIKFCITALFSSFDPFVAAAVNISFLLYCSFLGFEAALICWLVAPDMLFRCFVNYGCWIEDVILGEFAEEVACVWHYLAEDFPYYVVAPPGPRYIANELLALLIFFLPTDVALDC